MRVIQINKNNFNIRIKIYTFESILLMLSNINITPVKTKVEIIVLVQFVKWSNILSKLWLILISHYKKLQTGKKPNKINAFGFINYILC